MSQCHLLYVYILSSQSVKKPYLYNKPLDGQAVDRLKVTVTPKTLRGYKQKCIQQGVTEYNDLRGTQCAMWGLTLQRPHQAKLRRLRDQDAILTNVLRNQFSLRLLQLLFHSTTMRSSRPANSL